MSASENNSLFELSAKGNENAGFPFFLLHFRDLRKTVVIDNQVGRSRWVIASPKCPRLFAARLFQSRNNWIECGKERQQKAVSRRYLQGENAA